MAGVNIRYKLTVQPKAGPVRVEFIDIGVGGSANRLINIGFFAASQKAMEILGDSTDEIVSLEFWVFDPDTPVVPGFWTHPQLPAEPGEDEGDYIERFSEFSHANEGREIRGLE